MLTQREGKSAGLKYMLPVALVVGFVVVVVFLGGREVDQSATLADNSATSELSLSTNAIASDVRNDNQTFESDGTLEPSSHQLWQDDRAADGQFDTAGFSVEDVRVLHARQQQDEERMLNDGDAIAIESGLGGGAGITVAELRSIHVQQSRESEFAADSEIVIPGAADGSAALTVADLRAMQEKQWEDVGDSAYAHAVIPGSTDGTVDLTNAEIAALQERQRVALENNSKSLLDRAAPVPQDGSIYSSVDDVRNIQKSQKQDQNE